IRQSLAPTRHRHAAAGRGKAGQAGRQGHHRDEVSRQRKGATGMALASDPTSAVAVRPALKPSWNPLRFNSPELPVELQILAKTLAFVLLLVNHVKILPDPWLPFAPGIDRIPAALFQRTLQTVFVASALAILFNRRMRLFSLILGSTILLAVVSSKAY